MATLNLRRKNRRAPDVRVAMRERLRSMRTALVVAALFAMTLLWLIDSSFRQLTSVNTQRQDIEVVRSTISSLANTLTVAESSQRGYVLSGSSRDLTLFEQANKRMDDLLSQLDRKLEPSYLNAGAVAGYKALLDSQMQRLQAAVGLYRDGRIEAAQLAASSAGIEQDMQAVRDSSARLMSQADALIAQQQVAFNRLVTYSRLAFLACVLAVLFGFLLYTHQRYRLRHADLERQLMLQAERDLLEERVRVRTRDLNELATYLQQTVERERAFLARELHDELGALMSAAKFDIARIRSRLPADATDVRERLAHLKTTLNAAIALKRRIMEDLFPSALHNLGLVPALEALTRDFAERSGIPLTTELQPLALDEDAQLAVYRLIQEALTNIAKYAHATQVHVSVVQQDRAAAIRVQDNGDGFDVAQKSQGAHGLAGMRHRLQSCNGKLKIRSQVGVGTQIIARIPLTQTDDVVADADADADADPATASAPAAPTTV